MADCRSMPFSLCNVTNVGTQLNYHADAMALEGTYKNKHILIETKTPE